MIRDCALCRKRAELMDSHLVPMWAYKRIRELDPSRPQAPVYVADGNAVLSNKQTRMRLLCAHCEQRFSMNEGYIARLTIPDNGQTKLLDKITRVGSGERVLASLDVEEDGEQLTYFAASLMWRCAVMTAAYSGDPRYVIPEILGT